MSTVSLRKGHLQSCLGLLDVGQSQTSTISSYAAVPGSSFSDQPASSRTQSGELQSGHSTCRSQVRSSGTNNEFDRKRSRVITDPPTRAYAYTQKILWARLKTPTSSSQRAQRSIQPCKDHCWKVFPESAWEVRYLHHENGLQMNVGDVREKEIFLINGPYILQHDNSGRIDVLPEKILVLHQDFVACPCDMALPYPWVLLISQLTIATDKSRNKSPRPSRSKTMLQRQKHRRSVDDFLLIFNDLTELRTWQAAAQAEIEKLGGVGHTSDSDDRSGRISHSTRHTESFAALTMSTSDSRGMAGSLSLRCCSHPKRPTLTGQGGCFVVPDDNSVTPETPRALGSNLHTHSVYRVCSDVTSDEGDADGDSLCRSCLKASDDCSLGSLTRPSPVAFTSLPSPNPSRDRRKDDQIDQGHDLPPDLCPTSPTSPVGVNKQIVASATDDAPGANDLRRITTTRRSSARGKSNSREKVGVRNLSAKRFHHGRRKPECSLFPGDSLVSNNEGSLLDSSHS